MKMSLLVNFRPFCPFVLYVTQISNKRKKTAFSSLYIFSASYRDSVTERTKVTAASLNAVNLRQHENPRRIISGDD
ncbi:MAG: hypothetical protein ACOYIA_00955 [Eubacteriales bacterium]|jgi:hypothetical protein